MLREIHWFETPQGSSEEDVAAVECALGCELPADFRGFLKSNGGGSPIETDFTLDEPRGPFFASIGVFLAAVDGAYSILTTSANLGARGLSGLVPIAESGGGDLVCLDYREGPSPTIVYQHQGRFGLDDEVVPICATFADFLELLREPDDE